MNLELHRLLAVIGAALMFGAAWALKPRGRAVSWRPVAWGVAAQWALGALLLRVPAGRRALEVCSEGVQRVLDQSFEGSKFVFGQLGAPQGGESGLGVVFAFQVLPTIIFIASLFSLLYYLGVMQKVVRVLAWAMVRTMGTSGRESLAVAASVFMGQTEAPLTIRPFLAQLTESELFVVMVSGMASVSGAVLGAYVLIGGVDMANLLVAVAMTAPASIVMAKLVVPEHEDLQDADDLGEDATATETNALSAIVAGARDGLELALNVGAMLIAFIALVAVLNLGFGLLTVGDEALSLQRILGWLFWPFAVLMGVPFAEATPVASVLGSRTILNELIAFGDLDRLTLSARSQAIATVAICGFANLSSIGIQIGGLGAIVPSRRADIARLGLRALVAATLANFSSACVAGALLS